MCMYFEPIDRFDNARCVTVCDSVKDLSIPNHYSSNLSVYISTQPDFKSIIDQLLSFKTSKIRINPGKNFRITPDINYAFCFINYASALLSSKTMANSPEYCVYTSVMNTYCVSKRGFQFLSLFHLHLSLSFFPSHSPTTLSSAPRFLYPFFFSVVGEI